ncbi:MAG: manganese efflux pump [Clostridia bacterium]|nr:manganese efflux pump [Clostridia bacterium]
MTLSFLLNSLLLGVGLAMDAFSVSLANGLSEPKMRVPKALGIAGTFALFQAAMPLLGWLCVHAAVETFQSIQPFIPWAALILLCFIGGKMLWEAKKGKDETAEAPQTLTLGVLLLQGVATSIDALSVGFTIAHYGMGMALVCASLIAAVTFVICVCGVELGKRFGTRFAGKAEIVGGLILIGIGLEIWIKGVFFAS